MAGPARRNPHLPFAEALDKLKILPQWNERMDNPKRFDGTNCYAGSLLLIGDLVD